MYHHEKNLRNLILNENELQKDKYRGISFMRHKTILQFLGMHIFMGMSQEKSPWWRKGWDGIHVLSAVTL